MTARAHRWVSGITLSPPRRQRGGDALYGIAHHLLRRDLDVNAFCFGDRENSQFAVAVPKSRGLLEELVDQDLGNDECPLMTCGDVRIGGVAARSFRISFSGELAYEVAVPARYGAAMFDLLTHKAETLEGGLYGVEALMPC